MSSESDEEDLEGLSSSEESEAVTEAFEGISRNFELPILNKILMAFISFYKIIVIRTTKPAFAKD